MNRELPPLVETAIRGKLLRRAVVGVVILLAAAFAVAAALSPPSAPAP